MQREWLGYHPDITGKFYLACRIYIPEHVYIGLFWRLSHPFSVYVPKKKSKRASSNQTPKCRWTNQTHIICKNLSNKRPCQFEVRFELYGTPRSFVKLHNLFGSKTHIYMKFSYWYLLSCVVRALRSTLAAAMRRLCQNKSSVSTNEKAGHDWLDDIGTKL